MSIWGDMLDRGRGDAVRKEDLHKMREELSEVLKDMVKNQSPLRLKDILEKINVNFPWGDLLSFDTTPYSTVPSHFTAEEEHYLKVCAAIPFKLGVFSSLEDMLKALGVQVIIEPGIKYHVAPLELVEEMLFWKKEVERLKEERGPEYEDATTTLEKIREEIDGWNAMPLRGEYLHPVIKLYPDEMHRECEHYNGPISRTPTMNNLLISTLAHEAMHAYFNRYSRYELPYISSVEEPMTEFGMLLFLNEAKLNGAYRWALGDTAMMKSCYRYGASIMQQHLREIKNNNGSKTPTRRDLELYKRKLY